MRTIEVKVYQFNELNEQAKEKAKEAFRKSANKYWWKNTYQDMERMGLSMRKVFVINKIAKGCFVLPANEVAENILSYYLEQSNIYKIAEQFINNKLTDELFLESLLIPYSNNLQKEYENTMDDLRIHEFFILAGYEFLEDGTRY